jgi:ribosomal protein S18 acetylase RimI-like enzyme
MRANAAHEVEEKRSREVAGVAIVFATVEHLHHLPQVRALMLQAARSGAAISVRPIEMLATKVRAGEAVIALTESGEPVGFVFLSAWEDGRFVSHSGMVVAPGCRGNRVARKLKEKVFELSRRKYPQARIFSLTTSEAVLALNRALGFRVVRYEEVTRSGDFWAGCETCPFHAILLRNRRRSCRCTASVCDLPGRTDR